MREGLSRLCVVTTRDADVLVVLRGSQAHTPPTYYEHDAARGAFAVRRLEALEVFLVCHRYRREQHKLHARVHAHAKTRTKVGERVGVGVGVGVRVGDAWEWARGTFLWAGSKHANMSSKQRSHTRAVGTHAEKTRTQQVQQVATVPRVVEDGTKFSGLRLTWTCNFCTSDVQVA